MLLANACLICLIWVRCADISISSGLRDFLKELGVRRGCGVVAPVSEHITSDGRGTFSHSKKCHQVVHNPRHVKLVPCLSLEFLLTKDMLITFQ